MTREQEIKEMAKIKASHITSDKDMQVAFADALRSGAEWADSHPHWISVEEELPTKAEFYLCVIGDTIQVLFYNEGLEEWYEFYVTKEEHLDCEDWTKKVTHWMPLPQPPMKGE